MRWVVDKAINNKCDGGGVGGLIIRGGGVIWSTYMYPSEMYIESQLKAKLALTSK